MLKVEWKVVLSRLLCLGGDLLHVVVLAVIEPDIGLAEAPCPFTLRRFLGESLDGSVHTSQRNTWRSRIPNTRLRLGLLW